MIKKVAGILIVGLLIATILPVGSAIDQSTEASQIEITMKGGWGLQAVIKNTGTTDLTDAKIALVLDGRLIFPGFKTNDGTINIEAGKTRWVIFPMRGFGATNIELSVDTTTETASGIVLGSLVIGVK